MWTFLHEFDAKFLLANNARSQLPNHFQLEAGFDTNMSDITDAGHGKQMSDLKAKNGSVGGLTSMLSDCLKTKKGSNKEKTNTPFMQNCGACL